MQNKLSACAPAPVLSPAPAPSLAPASGPFRYPAPASALTPTPGSASSLDPVLRLFSQSLSLNTSPFHLIDLTATFKQLTLLSVEHSLLHILQCTLYSVHYCAVLIKFNVNYIVYRIYCLGRVDCKDFLKQCRVNNYVHSFCFTLYIVDCCVVSNPSAKP